MINKTVVIIAAVIVIGIAVTITLSQEGGITSNAGERYFQMINDSAPSGLGDWDCSTYEAINDFGQANGEAIREYERNFSEGQRLNFSILFAQWHQICG